MGISLVPPWIGWLLILVPVLSLVVSAAFMVRGYVLTDTALIVKRPGWTSRLDLSRLNSAVVDPDALQGSLRLFGNGGFFSFTGWFRNKKFGVYRAFATDAKKAVVLRFADKTVVITPDDPQKFVAEIKPDISMKLDDIQRAAQEQFARRSESYGKGHILENVEDVQATLKSIHLPTRAKVLDVATGAGHTGLFLASLGHDVTLADIAQPMLDKAAQTATERGLTVKTIQHPAEQFPHASESFDLVTCRVAAHHFSFPEKFVSESARVLKPGGYYLLIDGTVADDQPEAEAWIHSLEKLRDPSHNRFLTPRVWSAICETYGLAVASVKIFPFKQPDLNWYFETAATPDENRIKVLELIRCAPASAKSLFQIGEEDGKIVWWWQRLTLIATKAG